MSRSTIFCNDCKEKLTMHADGTIACSCATFADPDDANEAIPSGWNATPRRSAYDSRTTCE